MPSPVYILCSESGAEDRETGRLSLFNIIEQVNFARQQQGSASIGTFGGLSIQAVAVWAKEESDDPEQEFEFSFVVQFPGRDLLTAHSGKFRFQGRLSRLILQMMNASFDAAGEFSVECQIRKYVPTDAKWMCQRYSFPVVELPPPAG
jgi:hypothetical protein